MMYNKNMTRTEKGQYKKGTKPINGFQKGHPINRSVEECINSIAKLEK